MDFPKLGESEKHWLHMRDETSSTGTVVRPAVFKG